jgi:subtilisin family serine protease
MKSYLSAFIAACLLATISANLLAEPPEVTELIVRFKELSQQGATAQALADPVVRRQSPDSLKQLSYPASARPLIKGRGISTRQSADRAPGDKAVQRKKSAREKLEEFVILKYPNREALEAAKAAFENDPNVIWVGENSTFTLNALPADPLVPQALEDMDYQWGLHALKLPETWDYIQGHAYVGVIDVGIETAHSDLQDNFRPHLSYDFGHIDSDVDELAPNIQSDGEVNIDDVPFGNAPDRVGHGTHVAGIIAATANNTIGGSGVCWHCSLMIGKAAKIDTYISNNYMYLHFASALKGIVWMVDSGAQVINMSFGGAFEEPPCTDDPEGPFCLTLTHAKRMDVVMVAAAGNESDQSVDFPAADPSVIGVGAIDIDGNAPIWSSAGPEKELVAPGVHILSTFYTGVEYLTGNNGSSDEFKPECTNSLFPLPSHGPCSGTSMATPHISGAAALLRSANPLLTTDQIRELLIQYASQAENPDNAMGHGLPNMLESVRAALGTAAGQTLVNRLTPLFRLYSRTAQDSLYTSSPQMAMAAMYETLQPQPEGEGTRVTWTPAGKRYTPGYSSFPRLALTRHEMPKADAYIFTTHRNPINPERELVPLYRLSYQGNYTGNNPSNVDHIYTTEQEGVDYFGTLDYKLDGIEGYIFPDYEAQPPGTEKLYRKYNPSRDDHAIFPESMLSQMTAAGYTRNTGNEWIGYVYPNVDSDNDGLIDGFERVIGTDSNIPDSDQDGILDGTEVNVYPYSDPLDNIAASPLFLHKTPRELSSSWYSLAFKVQEEEGNGGSHALETLSYYLAVH